MGREEKKEGERKEGKGQKGGEGKVGPQELTEMMSLADI